MSIFSNKGESPIHILVINSGSSSIKYQLFDMDKGTPSTYGLVEKIGEPSSQLTHHWHDAQGTHKTSVNKQPITTHQAAFGVIQNVVRETDSIPNVENIKGIGHRVVHGGETFQKPTLITKAVLDSINAVSPLAPLHNPANVTGIEICLASFPKIPQVAVFDTAFHQTMPAHAYTYALPTQWYDTYGVRRYGFHGTSHSYVAKQAATFLNRSLKSLNLISLHLGNGASAAAIKEGQCIDTSMGLTPLAGLMMGSRCGDIDPAIPFYMIRETGMTTDEMDAVLNKQSGLKGVCGINDMREILYQEDAGKPRAKLAIDMYCYHIKIYRRLFCCTWPCGRINFHRRHW